MEGFHLLPFTPIKATAMPEAQKPDNLLIAINILFKYGNMQGDLTQKTRKKLLN